MTTSVFNPTSGVVDTFYNPSEGESEGTGAPGDLAVLIGHVNDAVLEVQDQLISLYNNQISNAARIVTGARPANLPAGHAIYVTPTQPTDAQTGDLWIQVTVPTNSILPLITGTTVLGDILTTTTGTWTNSPTTYVYQWLRNGTPISGATFVSYTLVSADVGTNISVQVTATNSSGSGLATSATVGPITS